MEIGKILFENNFCCKKREKSEKIFFNLQIKLKLNKPLTMPLNGQTHFWDKKIQNL